MGVTDLVFSLQAPRAEIKGVFYRLYCYYGHVFRHENDHNLFTKNLTFV